VRRRRNAAGEGEARIRRVVELKTAFLCRELELELELETEVGGVCGKRFRERTWVAKRLARSPNAPCLEYISTIL
jgi:hypothetical protein